MRPLNNPAGFVIDLIRVPDLCEVEKYQREMREKLPRAQEMRAEPAPPESGGSPISAAEIREMRARRGSPRCAEEVFVAAGKAA